MILLFVVVLDAWFTQTDIVIELLCCHCLCLLLLLFVLNIELCLLFEFAVGR
jgi:hypothetical protein